MQLDPDKVIAVLQKVRVVREHLAKNCQKPQNHLLSIMDLHWAVEDIYNLKIEMWEVSYEATYSQGTVERYASDRARIFIRSDQTDFDRRFTTVKELSHIIIDEKDDWSIHGVDTIKGLVTEWRFTIEDQSAKGSPAKPLQSELLAVLAAIELMYPFEFRATDIDKLNHNLTSIAKIALTHESPEHCIEDALRQHDQIASYWLRAGGHNF
jgi:hypothetical protein